MARVETTVSLFRGSSSVRISANEIHALAQDLAAASLLIELGASRGLALYFSEDGT